MFNRTSPCKAAAARRRRPLSALAAAGLVAACASAFAATDISTVPLPTFTIGTTVDVKPNILMVLDDSGSMDWTFLPDWANVRPGNYDSLPPYLTRNSAFNGVAYNPAVRYLPPVGFKTDGSKDTTTYPSMTGTTAATGADTGQTRPNWRMVKNDGYGVQSSGTSNLTTAASYYTVVPGEYCNSPALVNCTTTTAPTGNYAYPAPLRWCDSAALTNCRGLQGGSFTYPRIPAPRVATITFSSASGASVTGITVDGLQIMSGATTSSGTSSTVASLVATAINNCSNSSQGNCTVTGYSASSSDRTVTIYAPGAISSTPVVSYSGTLGRSITAFARAPIPLAAWLDGSTSSAAVPGENLRTVITPNVNSYPYPGSATKAAGRTDCAGTTCTYQEEMTNYANWFAYYRTRMQMMKTSTSRAFSELDSDEDIAAGTTRYRVGFLTLNNNTGTDFVNINDFTPAQKVTWFSKLFAAEPESGTPLRQALARAGQLYAGVLNGTTLNGVRVTEPLQFSCQKNYTILSTDGFWNGSAGTKLDRTSSIGNTDGMLPRPYNDGTAAVIQHRTSTLQQQKNVLQKRTSSNGRNWSSWQGTSSCTPQRNRVECRTQYGSWTNAPSCTVDSSPDGQGNTIDCRYTTWTGWSNTSACSPLPRSDGPVYTVGTARECQGTTSGGTSHTLADVAAYYYATDLRDPTATGENATGTCTGPVVPPATTASDLCANNVTAAGRDNNPRQHMTTHTLGLGAQGRMVFSPYQNDRSGQRVYNADYWSQVSGDFYAVATGSTASPSTGICSWQSAGTTCTWPTPAADSPANIDDLWHAAVNGHGTYFSAQDPSSLADALTAVLNQIVNTPRPGTAAAAASSNPNITSSDNYVFSSSYRSIDWYGELIMQRLNSDGTLTGQRWSAKRLLDCATTPWQANRQWEAGQTFSQGGYCRLVMTGYTSGASYDASNLDSDNTLPLSGRPTTRTIYTVGGTTPSLVPFTWASLSAAQRAWFSIPHITYTSATDGLTQFCTVGSACLGATAQASAQGEALVDFLRGDRTHEATYFRRRTHVLGDIVASEARYVKAPLQEYTDAGFAEYKAAQADRPPTVYVGSNDGMLHAFNALTGQERWAFIPSAVLPGLYRLADSNYAEKHRYFVDGTPEVGEICPSAPTTPCTASTWKTILVGGLNQGGKAFYALDITDPTNPSLLWEFTHADLGYSYSNPRINKLSNGTWVVTVASGYNNTDGIGRLFVLNANTGALIDTISTGVGSADNPSGLARLTGYASAGWRDNTIEQMYGGDLMGNVWRFDLNGNIGAGGTDAHRLVTLKDAAGVAQPITARPAVGTIQEKPVVIVGTGRYLGVSDLADTRTYTMYAIKDKLDTTTLTSPRETGSNFVAQTMVESECPAGTSTDICQPGQTVRTVSANPVDWAVKNGWYTDFALDGERAVTDATMALGTLVFTTIKPQSATADAIQGCTGASQGTNAVSYLYYLDYLTGGAIDGTKNVVGEELCTCIATRPSVVRTQSGTLKGIIRTSGGGSGDGGNGGGSGGTSDEDYETGGGGCTAGEACGDGEDSDEGQTMEEGLPYKPDDRDPRRISWRELNGR